MNLTGIYLVGGLRFHPTFEELLNAVDQALQGGIRIFQLRAKDTLNDQDHIILGRKLRELTRRHGASFVINDRPDIAVLCQADALHLGPTDMLVKDARKIVGEMTIGRSCHNFDQLHMAAMEDVDYLSVGPVNETDCKKEPDPTVGLDFVKRAIPYIKKPLMAIGGINLENIEVVLSTGIQCVGVIRGIMSSNDLQGTAKAYVEAFEQYKQPMQK